LGGGINLGYNYVEGIGPIKIQIVNDC